MSDNTQSTRTDAILYCCCDSFCGVDAFDPLYDAPPPNRAVERCVVCKRPFKTVSKKVVLSLSP